jgi:glycine/D-amino acid oxidase-like deaminating enzyme
MKRLVIAILALWLACNLQFVWATEIADIVIYGGTSSGIIAAVQAHRLGKSVVLVEPSNHLGGLTTGGLGATDIGNKAAIGGLARDFYHRIWQHYENDAVWNRETRTQYSAHNPRSDSKDETMWMFEPHAAGRVYRELLAEAAIKPLMNERLDRLRGVKKNAARIESITMESGRAFAAKHADAIIAWATGVEGMKEYRADIRKQASAAGRDPDDVKVMFLVSPILGETEVEGFHVSSGWGTYGFKAAPIVGKTLAELAATGKTPELIEPFKLERFYEDKLVSELAAAAVSH